MLGDVSKEELRTARRTAAVLGCLLIAIAVAAAAMLVPYTAGVSRQHDNALHFWLHGCPADEGEAWSSEPVNLGQRARRECRDAALARSAIAAASLLLAGGVILFVQLTALAHPRTEENGFEWST